MTALGTGLHAGKKPRNTTPAMMTEVQDRSELNLTTSEQRLKSVAKALSDKPASSVYINVIKMGGGDLSWGIASRQVLPSVGKFSLFPRWGEVEVTLMPYGEQQLTDSELKNIVYCHQLVFKDVLCSVKSTSMVFDQDNSPMKFLIVPVVIGKCGGKEVVRIAWEVLDRVKNSPVQQNAQSFSPEQLSQAVVSPSYRKDGLGLPDYYFVTDSNSSITPSSSFPEGKFANYQQYYESQHKLKLKDSSRSLLEVEQVRARPHQDVLIYREFNKTSRPVYVPAEVCNVHPLPSELWRQAICLPAAIHRINSLLIADELRLQIFNITEVGGNVATSDGLSESFQALSLDSVISKDSAPPPGLLLQALTTAKAHHGYDLETLETLGDSLLKFAVGLTLYWTHTESDEGELSQKRSALVSNSSLSKRGEKLNLSQKIMNERFVPYESTVDTVKTANWLPPCYKVTGGSQTLVYQLLMTQEVSLKCVADSVEALIGAYLRVSGVEAAFKVLTAFDFVVISPFEIRKKLSGSPPNQKVVENQKAVEKALNYKFRNSSVLLEALTHSSKGSWNYQRLEFLGDALLDFLITRELFTSPECDSPKKLTDLRSVLVNNTIFACHIAKIGVASCVIEDSEPLAETIKEFVAFRKSIDHEISGEYCLFDGQGTDCVEVPKALGDVFEALAGAVFIDSGLSFDKTWKVFRRLMEEEIRQFFERYACSSCS